MSSELTTLAQHREGLEGWLRHPSIRNALVEGSPRDFSGVALARAALTMIKYDDKLAECGTNSILNSVLICAQTGLMPGPMGFCALVPYSQVCQFQLMYKGAVNLVRRSGYFAALACEVVYEGDQFEYEEGSDAFVQFRRNLRESERGEPIAAFASVRAAEGPPSVRVMGIEELEAVRKKYDRGKRSDRPWLTQTDEMYCKTVLKRTLKRLPMSAELALAVGMDDLAEIGKQQEPVGPRMEDLPAPEDPGDFCNKDIGDEGLVCSQRAEHKGDCK